MIYYKRIKYLLCVVFATTLLYSCNGQKQGNFPKPIGYVNDFEKVFSANEVKFLDSIISDFDHRTTNQLSVITIDTSMVRVIDFDNYILKIHNAWGVGQKGKNNGIVIGLSKGYRHMRISNGYGIEKIISDAETKTIIDSVFIPFFKKGLYFEGTLQGLKTIMARLENK